MGFANDLIDFLYKSPTAFNAVEESKKILDENDFKELNPREVWNLKVGGKYYVTKNLSSIVAFTINSNNIQEGFRIIGSHSDSPSFKIKPNPEMISENTY